MIPNNNSKGYIVEIDQIDKSGWENLIQIIR